MSFPFFLLFLLYPGLTAGQTPAPEIELEEAYFREVAALDPEGAVEGYKKALADARQPSRARARACLRLGICYRLLGDLKGSRESFETVVKDYASETDVARLAERYLSERPPESPARFFPEDVLFYVELVDPKEHVRTLSELLRGTQFENPVNYYVSYLARQTAGGPEPTDSEGLA